MEIVDNSLSDLVSIIIPVFNSVHYLKGSILSAAKQTYKNIEIIIVDDGSTDGSLEVAEEIHCLDNRIHIIRQANKGQGITRNTGLNFSKGGWVYFLDADDTISLNAIEILLNSAKEHDSDFVFSSFRMTKNQINDDLVEGPILSKEYDPKQLCRDFLLRKTILIAPGTLIKKAFLLENNILFKSIPWSEDQHFVWQLLKYANKISNVTSVFYHYLFHENSIMTGTRFHKIIESYPFFVELEKKFNYPLVSKYLAARWVIGSLNSSTYIENFENWKELYKGLDTKKQCKILRTFPDKKIRLTTLFLRFFPKTYYSVVKKRKTKQ